MGKSFKVLILNEHRFPSAVFRYGLDIMQAVGDRSKFLNIVYNRAAWPQEYAPLCTFGRFSHPSVNYLLRGIAFPELPAIVKSVNSAGGLIHYASVNVPPVSEDSSRSIVTVHDNPRQLLETDLYHEVKAGVSEKLIRNSSHRRLRRNIRKFKRFENVLADTEYVRKSILEYGFEGEVKVIPPPVSPSFKHIEGKSELRRKLNLPPDKKLVLSVSTLAKRKNVVMVQRTMELLGEGHTLVRLGPPLGSSITFSNVDMDTVNEIYNVCDVLLFPTLAEGFGYPVVEAFKAGLPVVASDIEVIREVAGGAAILVNPKDEKSVARGVQSALEAPQPHIEKGFARADAFTFELFKKKMFDYYEGLA